MEKGKGDSQVKLTIQIPDELGETLNKYTTSRTSIEAVAARILETFPVDLREPYIFLTAADRKEIERLLAVPTPNAKELLRRIATHASVTTGNIRLNPTAAQVKKIEARAKANGRSAQEEAEAVFKSIAPNYFGYV